MSSQDWYIRSNHNLVARELFIEFQTVKAAVHSPVTRWSQDCHVWLPQTWQKSSFILIKQCTWSPGVFAHSIIISHSTVYSIKTSSWFKASVTWKCKCQLDFNIKSIVKLSNWAPFVMTSVRLSTRLQNVDIFAPKSLTVMLKNRVTKTTPNTEQFLLHPFSHEQDLMHWKISLPFIYTCDAT